MELAVREIYINASKITHYTGSNVALTLHQMYSESIVTSCLVADQSECPEPPLALRQKLHGYCQIVIIEY